MEDSDGSVDALFKRITKPLLAGSISVGVYWIQVSMSNLKATVESTRTEVQVLNNKITSWTQTFSGQTDSVNTRGDAVHGKVPGAHNFCSHVK